MNKKQTQMIHKEAGFVLFVALITASFILAVGLGVSSLSIRGFQLSNNTTESIKALYAANAGIECALYYDLKDGSDPFGLTVDSSGNLLNIQKPAGGAPLSCSSSLDSGGLTINPNDSFYTDYVGGVLNTNPVWFWLSFRTKQDPTDFSGDGPCVYVEIKKTIIGLPSNGQFSTKIDAYGYNLHGRDSNTPPRLTCANGIAGSSGVVASSPPGRVERLLESNY